MSIARENASIYIFSPHYSCRKGSKFSKLFSGFMLKSINDPDRFVSPTEMQDFVKALLENKPKEKVLLQDTIQISKTYDLKNVQLQKSYNSSNFTKRLIYKGEKSFNFPHFDMIDRLTY